MAIGCLHQDQRTLTTRGCLKGSTVVNPDLSTVVQLRDLVATDPNPTRYTKTLWTTGRSFAGLQTSKLTFFWSTSFRMESLCNKWKDLQR
jgi:hypothetical protein